MPFSSKSSIRRTSILSSQRSSAVSFFSPLLSGAAWFDKWDYSRAIADFEEALKLAPRLADAYCNRGVAQLMQDKLAEAEADFARCRKLGGTLKPEAERLLRQQKDRWPPRQ